MKLIHVSNKKLVLISLLSFSSGLALLGNANIAKADTVSDGSSSGVVASVDQNTSSSTATQTNTSTTSTNNTQGTNNIQATNSTDGNNTNQNNTSNSNNGTTNNNSTQPNVQNSSNNNTSYKPTNVSRPVSYAVAAPVQATTTTNADNTTFAIPADIPADHQGTLSGDGGSSWYLDHNTLNIGPGNITDPVFDSSTSIDNPNSDMVWSNYKYYKDIDTLNISQGAVAGTSLKNYFNGLIYLNTLDVSNLDVSKTTDFSGMFANTDSIIKLDISNWKLSDGVDFSNFLNNSGIQFLNLSGLKFTNANLSGAFELDDFLKSLNQTGTTFTDITNADSMFNKDANLPSLDLTEFTFNSGASINSMLGGLVRLKSLTVRNDTVLDGTGLVNPNEYQGWTDGTNLYNSDNLMKVYGNNSSINESARTSTTWTPVKAPSVNYTINYYDDQTKKLIDSVTGAGEQGGELPVKPNYPGYSTTVDDLNEPVILPSADLGQTVPDQSYDFYLAPLPHSYVTVNESEKGSSSNLNSQEIDLVSGDTDANNAAISKVKDNLAQDRTLVLDETSVDISFGGTRISGKLNDMSTFSGYTVGQILWRLTSDGQYTGFPEDATASDLIDRVAKLVGSNDGTGSLNLVYEAKPGTGSNNNNSGDNNSTTLKDQKAATTTSVVKLYDANGKLITNRGLNVNTAWKSDAIYNFNGVMYYRVSTDEYVKASDVYIYTDKIANIKVNDGQNGDLVDYLGGDLDRKLKSGSEWKTDRIALINGKEYYRVSTDEFIPVSEVTEY
ncbi:SLAP domain-containing protein [Companilactobacillus tucceti]|nr:SLAP domain-containing protein [Companilactobacillus tucceti]